MRKTLGLALVLVFAIGFAAGYSTPEVEAKGGGGSCYYTCTCDGTALKCCVTPFGVFCAPTNEFGCPQVYNC